MRLAQSLGLLFLLGVGVPQAHAAESYDNCTGFIDSLPAVIGTQGVWCLRADLSTSLTAGDGVSVTVNNVTIDCNDFKLGGLAGGPMTGAVGIRAQGVLNTTVRQCNVRGFHTGIWLEGGGQLVEDNRLEGNTTTGIWLGGGNGTVRRNLVLDTGGGPYSLVFGIHSSGDNDIRDNTVSEVGGTEPVALAMGIYTVNMSTAHVTGNRLRGIRAPSTGQALAIHSTPDVHAYPVIAGNHLSSDDSDEFGIYCGYDGAPRAAQGIAMDNAVAGFLAPVSGCTGTGNAISLPIP